MKSVAIFLCSGVALSAMAQTNYSWQHTDVGSAWRSGFQGQGVTVQVNDDLSGVIGGRSWVNLNGANRSPTFVLMTHGDIVSEVVRRTAPLASIDRSQMLQGNIGLHAGRLNVINASWGFVGGTDLANQAWIKGLQVVNLAHGGSAVVVKAAGNNGRRLSDQGAGDGLNMALETANSVIFAGALQNHGTPVQTLRLGRWSFSTGGTSNAQYTNTPGIDTDYQQRFLMVGVPQSMSVAGTSFAAPQISAYAAMVGSKFRQATPVQITSQLLSTARKDTIRGYNPADHGRGEASLSRALAPLTIN